MKEISIFKIKDGKSYSKIVDDKLILKHPDVINNEFEIDYPNLTGIVFIGHNDQKPVSWLDDIKSLSSNIDDEIRNQSSRAVAVISVDNNLYAVTFGHGRYMLNEELIIRNFGRKIVLNLVEADSIKKTQTSSIGDYVTSYSSSASKQTDIKELRINTDSDLLMKIEGEIQVLSLTANAVGRDSINLAFKEKIEWEKVKDLTKELEEHYSKNKYKEKFGWIDNLVPVQDENLINQVYFKAIKDFSKTDSHLHLVNVDVLDDKYSYSYSITYKGEKFSDINNLKEDIIERWKLEHEDLSLKNTLTKSIFVHNETTDDFIKWSFKKTLVGELNLDKRTFTLFLGNIYEVDKDYAESINNKVKEIQDSKVYELDFDICIEDEKDYLINQSKNKEYLICLDRQNISYNGSSIEACDLLTNENELIHVKKWSSSSTLSHLFQQGIVSAQLLMNERDFRVELNKKLEERIQENTDMERDYKNFEIDADNFQTTNYTIIFSVLFKNDSYSFENLPMFSKIVLVNSVKELENYSYKVKLNRLQYIPT